MTTDRLSLSITVHTEKQQLGGRSVWSGDTFQTQFSYAKVSHDDFANRLAGRKKSFENLQKNRFT